MRLESSVNEVVEESKEPFGECIVESDMDEIAESIEEVRGACLPSGRREEPTSGGEAAALGDGGEEFPRVLVSGKGEETLRNGV